MCEEGKDGRGQGGREERWKKRKIEDKKYGGGIREVEKEV